MSWRDFQATDPIAKIAKIAKIVPQVDIGDIGDIGDKGETQKTSGIDPKSLLLTAFAWGIRFSITGDDLEINVTGAPQNDRVHFLHGEIEKRKAEAIELLKGGLNDFLERPEGDRPTRQASPKKTAVVTVDTMQKGENLHHEKMG